MYVQRSTYVQRGYFCVVWFFRVLQCVLFIFSGLYLTFFGLFQDIFYFFWIILGHFFFFLRLFQDFFDFF